MKVLLVHPPLGDLVSANVPTFVEEERGTYPPIGLLYVAAHLREHGPADVEVVVLDAILEELSHDAIARRIEQERPDVVGVQALTFTLVDALRVARSAKAVDPGIVTVFGGRHCDHYPRETAALDAVDYVVMGEGEVPFTQFISHLGDEDALRALYGLAFFASDGGFVRNPVQTITDLDALPFPARDLTDYRKYDYLLAKGSRFTTLITSRGCPFRCTFCDEGRMKFRALSAKRAVDEIQECKEKYGVTSFFIFDSTFTTQRRRVVEFCDELIRRDLGIHFDCRTRIDLIDDELMARMKQAGCTRIQFGVESGNDQIEKNIIKQITVSQVKEIIDLAVHRYGFEVLCDFMLGLPGETERELQQTVQLALELPIDYAHFAVTTPYPNTELYEQGIEKELFDDYWQRFAADPQAGFVPPVWEENFSCDELNAHAMKAYKSFYLRPGFIFRGLSRIRSMSELRQKLGAGLNLVRRTFAHA